MQSIFLTDFDEFNDNSIHGCGIIASFVCKGFDQKPGKGDKKPSVF